ncbi:MAG: hypothetical protein H0X15_14925, partial [Acidobacteria bacterium]|nr:hypothetical protein [Acidobacteriota bacterium]
MRHGDAETRRRGDSKQIEKVNWRWRESKFSASYLLSASRHLRVSASFFLLVLCFCSSIFPQQKVSSGWLWQNPRPQGNPLYAVHFAKDKETGFAVGSDNTILRTENGGFRWQKQFSPSDVTLSGVFVKDKKSAIVVGARGTIFLTDNGGKDWRRSVVEAKDHLYSLVMTGENFQTGWTVGTYGRIL